MTDTSNWKPYYKKTYSGLQETNLAYTPLINAENTVMCMHFFRNTTYSPGSTIDDITTNFLYEREKRFLLELENYAFTPNVLEIDDQNKKIFIEFSGVTLNYYLFTAPDQPEPEVNEMDVVRPGWQSEVLNIVQTLLDNSYYKYAIYPHCFFISNDGTMKAIDYYATFPFAEKMIELTTIQSVIGRDSTYRFAYAKEGDYVNFEKFFEVTINEHMDRSWPINPFTSLKTI